MPASAEHTTTHRIGEARQTNRYPGVPRIAVGIALASTLLSSAACDSAQSPAPETRPPATGSGEPTPDSASELMQSLGYKKLTIQEVTARNLPRFMKADTYENSGIYYIVTGGSITEIAFTDSNNRLTVCNWTAPGMSQEETLAKAEEIRQDVLRITGYPTRHEPPIAGVGFIYYDPQRGRPSLGSAGCY